MASHRFDDPATGFGLGVSVLLDLGKSQMLGSAGNFGWGGAANTNFWIDPQEELIGILMLQFMPSDTYPGRRGFPQPDLPGAGRDSTIATLRSGRKLVGIEVATCQPTVPLRGLRICAIRLWDVHIYASAAPGAVIVAPFGVVPLRMQHRTLGLAIRLRGARLVRRLLLGGDIRRVFGGRRWVAVGRCGWTGFVDSHDLTPV